MGDCSTYELKCKDRTLLSFEFVEDDFGQPGARIVSADERARPLLPWGLELTSDGLYSWLSRRSLPQNRRFSAELCRAMGLKIGDVEELYSACMGLSLNDSYWTPKAGEAMRFSDVNLYENGFSAALAAVAYTGLVPEGSQGSMHGLTPELTTDGTLRKAWRARGDERWLYKGASNGWVPGEPASERLVSYIARIAGIDAVCYGMETWEAELCSTCQNFCTKDLSYVPFAVATGETNMAAALKAAVDLDVDGLEKMADMLVLDALVCNPDRHFTNFGVLRDVDSGRALGLAPVFDNGRGLLPMVRDDMLHEARYQVATMGPSFGGRTFEDLASRIMGDRQLEWLERVKEAGITGAADDLDDASAADAVSRRAEGLDGLVRARAAELLEIPPVNRGTLLAALERVPQRQREDHALRAQKPEYLNPPLSRVLSEAPLTSETQRHPARVPKLNRER